MFLRAKKECNSGAPKRNGRLCLGGQGGAEKKNANWFRGHGTTNAWRAWKAEKRMIRVHVWLKRESLYVLKIYC